MTKAQAHNAEGAAESCHAGWRPRLARSGAERGMQRKNIAAAFGYAVVYASETGGQPKSAVGPTIPGKNRSDVS